MEELLRQLLENTHGLPAYATVFGILLVCGLGVPLPEDVSLILGGYLSHQGAASLLPMMAVGFAGILAGDSIIFFAGRRLGARVGRRPGGLLGRVVTPEKREKVQQLFARHGEKIVLIARFLPGVRAVTYFTAGSAGMRYTRFIFFDGAAALASAPVFVYLGYHFGAELEAFIQAFKRGQLSVIAGAAALVLVFVGVKLLRRRARAPLAPSAQSAVEPLSTSGPAAAAPQPEDRARLGVFH